MKKLKKGFFTFWIDNYKVSFLFLALIVVAGILAMIQIPKESSPDIKFGIISIVTPYTGVNPQDIDSLITEKIENEIDGIEGIRKITSSSSVGISSVTVELENGVSTRDTMTDIKDKIDTLSLPSEASDTIVREISLSSELLFEALVYSETPLSNFELNQKAREIENALEGTAGISKISIGGQGGNPLGGGSGSPSDYNIRVLISKEKIELLGLSIANISSTLRSFNKNTPLGNYTIGDLNYDFRFEGEFSDIQELENTIIKGSGSSLVRLSDVAKIEKKYDQDIIKTLGKYNEKGKSYITLSFNKKNGDNVFSVSKTAKVALENFLSTESGFEDMKVVYSQDLGEVIVEDYKNLGNTAIQTIILVFITIFLFIGFRQSMIASILLPLSFFITFIVLNAAGYTLNFLTNFSLVLTLGIAIDTIIVIIEGATERQKLGYSRKNAVILAVQDLKAPLISGTLTTLAAFLPMIFLPGIVGKFLSYIPITVFITLLAALILSLTIASALFFKLSKKRTNYYPDLSHEATFSTEEKEFLTRERVGKTSMEQETSNYRDRTLDKMGNYYYKALSKVLGSRFSRYFSIIAPFFLLMLTIVFLSPRIGFTLFPASDEGVINITIEGQVGAVKETLERYIDDIESTLSSFEEMKVYYVTLSGNTIKVYVELTDGVARQKNKQKTVFEVESEILQSFEKLESQGLLVEIATAANGPPTGAPVGVKLITKSSKDIETLGKVANDFKAYLQTLQGTKNVTSSSSENPGQFVFTFDRAKLSFAGLTPNDILSEIQFYVFGIKTGSLASQYEDNDIVLSVAEFEETLNPSDITNLIISTRIGNVRVGDYVTYSFVPGLSSINREAGKITIGVNSDLKDGTLPTDIQPSLIEFANAYSFPAGITFKAGGENEENADLIFATVQSFVISIFLIFTILVFQFNSYTQPVIILYSVVLALLGVNIGLFITGNPYSMTFGIGFIALTGVVVNDAIILVDRMNRNLERLIRNSKGRELTMDDYEESIVAAGKSRLQPIIVTTLTTLFGVLPLALQDAFWAGLGFTIIFGLFAGSLMTLFVIPALYHVIYLKKKIRLGHESLGK